MQQADFVKQTNVSFWEDLSHITQQIYAWTGTWTLDTQIKSLMLYRLSYPGSERLVSSESMHNHICIKYLSVNDEMKIKTAFKEISNVATWEIFGWV